MRKQLLSIALICLLLLACNSKESSPKESESATTPQDDANQARVEDADTPREESEVPAKKKQTVEEALVDVKAAVEQAKKNHPNVDLSRLGITEEILAMYLAEGGEIPEIPQMPGFLDGMFDEEGNLDNEKVDL